MTTPTKESSLTSKKYFEEHKEGIKKDIHEIKLMDIKEDIRKEVVKNYRIDDVRKSQETEEYKKHAEVRKTDYKKIRELVIERVGDPKKVTKADIQEAIDSFYGKSEKKELNFEQLLNKPNMTAKDKANMEKSIKFLVDKKMDTSENLNKLEAINYGSNYIEIGGVKRARENLKAEPNNKDIFKHGDEVYFKFDALKEQNTLLAKNEMEIPGKDSFVKTLKALPGDFSENNAFAGYAGANILGNILDMSMSGCCTSEGKLINEGESGYVWSSSEDHSNSARSFAFGGDVGELRRDSRDSAFAVRPVLK